MTFVIAIPGYAQANRTWVSGVGDDANPCSRVDPCKTFAGAISKTAPGGEISVLDPGGYGAVTITKAITLNGSGTSAGILVSGGISGITVNAQPGDVVTIRSLNIVNSGIASGSNGIHWIAGGTLIVDKTNFYGFTGSSIDVDLATAGNLVVSDSSMSGGLTGVRVNTSSGRLNASLNRVWITGAATGVDASAGFTAISNSVITMSSLIGLLAENTGTLTSESNMVTMNGTALQADTGGTLRASNTDMFDNLTGFGCGGGTLASTGNNHKFGNLGGPPTCSPTVVVPAQ
jgi:hypothetical protein